MTNVYRFGAGVKSSTSWIEMTDMDPGFYIINCPVCGIRGLLPYPRIATHRAGLLITRPGTVDDLVFSGPGVWAMSARAQEAIKRSKLSGIRWTSPTEIVCKGSGPAWKQTVRRIEGMGFKIATVVGSGGSVAKTNNVRVTKHCTCCGWITWSRRPKVLKIDARQWDGSDFFVIEEYRARLFTQRAADAMAAARLSGFTAEPAGVIVE